jgi:glutaredoxin
MNFTIYSKPGCLYCDKAKALIDLKKHAYEELILDVGQVKDSLKTYVTVNQLREKVPNARTVPQIMKGNELIGGYDALEKFLN